MEKDNIELLKKILSNFRNRNRSIRGIIYQALHYTRVLRRRVLHHALAWELESS